MRKPAQTHNFRDNLKYSALFLLLFDGFGSLLHEILLRGGFLKSKILKNYIHIYNEESLIISPSFRSCTYSQIFKIFGVLEIYIFPKL